MAVKIAEGFVEVTARTDRTAAKKAAEEAARDSGAAFTRAFTKSSEGGAEQHRARFVAGYRQAGTRSGQVFARSAAREIFASKATDAAAAASGQRAGGMFTRAIQDKASKVRPLRGLFSRLRGDSDREGQGIGSRIVSGLKGAVKGGMGAVTSTFGGAFKAMGKMPWVMVAAVVAALAALPAAGAAAGTGLALAFGGGIAAVGILAAAQADKVKSAFSGLKDHVVARMKEISKPLQGTLVAVADQARGLFDSLAPHLEDAFAKMAPVLETFSGQLLGAFKGGSVIDSATGAFTALLEDLGPKLGPVFERMGAALNDLFGTIQENPAIFNGIITGALNLVTGLIRVVDWLSQAYVWVQEKLPGGMLTLISPMASLWLNLGKTAGAASGLKDKLKVMGDAFKEAWGFIKEGAMAIKDAVMPILKDIQNALADSNVLSKVSGWWDQIAEIVSLAGEFLGMVMKGIAAALTWIWDNFGTQIMGIFSGLWSAVEGIITGALEIIKGIFNTFIGVFTGDWSRAWEGIKQIFGGLWLALKGILVGALEIFKSVLSAALTIIKGIWGAVWGWISGFFGGIWDWIVDKVVAAKNWVVNTVTALRDRAVALFTNIRDWILERVLRLKLRAQLLIYRARLAILKTVIGLRNRAVEIFTNIRDWVLARVAYVRRWLKFHFHRARITVIRTILTLRQRAVDIFNKIRDWITDKARSLRDRVVGAVRSLKSRVIDAFEAAKDGVKKAWDKLKGIAKKPVAFVIDTVYNKGIVGVWNKIADKVSGIGTLREYHPKGFAKGGITDARGGAALPGFSSRDDQLAMVRSGEGVLVPEAVQSLGPAFVHTANRLKGKAGELLAKGLPGFAKGGIVGLLSGFGAKLKDGFKDGFKKVANATLNPLKSMFASRFGRSSKTFSGMPYHIVKSLISRAVSHLVPFGKSLEGGDGSGVVKEARKHIGLSGRPNKFTRPYMPGSWPWCGAFAGQMFERSGAGKAIRSVAWKPAVRSWRALPKVSASSARAGDVALYRGDDGHINIVADPKRKETIGGNESNAVRASLGYMNSASSIRRPKFAKGGVVPSPFMDMGDVAAFWHQDARETPDIQTGLRTRSLREIFSRDMGGILPTGTMAVNTSGQAEVVQTLEQLKAIAAAGGGTTIILQEGAIRVDVSDIDDVRRFVEMLADLPQTARAHGARIRAGVR